MVEQSLHRMCSVIYRHSFHGILSFVGFSVLFTFMPFHLKFNFLLDYNHTLLQISLHHDSIISMNAMCKVAYIKSNFSACSTELRRLFETVCTGKSSDTQKFGLLDRQFLGCLRLCQNR